MTRIKAKEATYSSVVGGGVLLLNYKGHMIGQLAFICHNDELRDKALQQRLAQVIVKAINEEQSE